MRDEKVYVQDIQTRENERTRSLEFQLTVEDKVGSIRSGRPPARVDVTPPGNMYRVLGCDSAVRACRQLRIGRINVRIWETEDEFRLARDGEPSGTTGNVTDHRGNRIPVHLREAYDRLSDSLELLVTVEFLGQRLDELKESKILSPALAMEPIHAGLTQAGLALRSVQPYSQCPRCGPGILKQHCPQCAGRGFISKAEFERLSQAEVELIDAA